MCVRNPSIIAKKTDWRKGEGVLLEESVKLWSNGGFLYTDGTEILAFISSLCAFQKKKASFARAPESPGREAGDEWSGLSVRGSAQRGDAKRMKRYPDRKVGELHIWQSAVARCELVACLVSTLSTS